jgi:hypothetical protein
LLFFIWLLSCSYNQKYQKDFAAIIVLVPACEPIPLALLMGSTTFSLLKGITI